MKSRYLTLLALAGALTLPATVINAADQDRDRDRDRDQTKEQLQIQDQDKMIYGWQLMTPQERRDHRAKMLSLKTEEERLAYREEHHKLMQQRAQERGLTLPDRPRRQGSGQGFGGGFSGSPGGGGGSGKAR